MKTKPVLNLILLGDVAAGKATQTAFLYKKYGLYDFDMGQVLRTSRKNNHTIDTVLKRTIDQGKLAPTAMVQRIFKDTVNKIPKSRGIAFDGTPKMLGEAKLLTKLLKDTHRMNPLVVYLQIPMAASIKRMKLRREHHQRRADDSITALKNRIKYYRKNIKEVVDYFQTAYTLVHIDGMGTKSQVKTRIQKAIDFYLKHYEQIYQNTGRN